jgi:predicted DNA-binding transcriptional regulator
MLSDLLQSTKETLTERLSSPLLGSFTIAWSLWNYKFLVILFSAESVTRTFELVDTVAFPDVSSVLLRGLLFPLLAALAYVFLYPYPARVIYGFTHRMRKATNRLRQQIEEETLLTVEESRKLRAQYIELEQLNQEKVDNLNSEIEKLKEALKNSGAVPRPTLSAAERLYDELELSQLELLANLNAFDGRATEEFLADFSQEPKLKVQFDLGELVGRGFLERNYDKEADDYFYSFTHEGRRALLIAEKLRAASEHRGGAIPSASEQPA